MADDKVVLLEDLQPWLLRRVAQSVEAGEVSVDLLTELQAAFKAAQESPHAEAYDASIAELAGVDETEARTILKAIL